MKAMKTVIYKQRYHQTTNLKAESVTQKSLNLVTCSLARLDLFPRSYVERGREKLIGRCLKENSIVNSVLASTPPAHSSVAAEKNSYMNCHTQLYC